MFITVGEAALYWTLLFRALYSRNRKWKVKAGMWLRLSNPTSRIYSLMQLSSSFVYRTCAEYSAEYCLCVCVCVCVCLLKCLSVVSESVGVEAAAGGVVHRR